MRSSVLLIALIISSFSVYAGNDENIAKVLRKGTKAVPLNIDAPVYPRRALERHIEGWVIVGFIIKSDGTTDKIEVLNSSIDNHFDDAAIEATLSRTYEPSTLRGEPVMQGNMSVRYVFQIKQSEGGVSRSFLKVYRKASRAVDDEDFELAKTLIDKLDGEERRLMAEVCYIDMLKARYFDKLGNAKATLKHVERALVIADTSASKPIYIHLLKQAIVANGKANNFRISLEHYNTLLEIDGELAPDDPIHKFVSHEKQILNGESNIQTTGTVSRTCRNCGTSGGYFWGHMLNRSRFSIDQVVGEVYEIEIVCQSSSVMVVYAPEMAWSVNQDGSECSIRVYGEKDTSFRLVELAQEV